MLHNSPFAFGASVTAAAVLAAAAPGYGASSLDTGFESGSLGPWTGIGDVRVVADHPSLDDPPTTAHDSIFAPRRGSAMAALTNDPQRGAVSADRLASATGLSDGFGGHAVLGGSAIFTTFHPQPGRAVRFDWLFDPDTDQGNPQTNDDLAFVAGSDGFFQVLADAYDTDSAYAWRSFRHAFDAAGPGSDPLTLTLGVLESADNGYGSGAGIHSALLIDGPAAAPGPEPTGSVEAPSPAALALGLAAGGLILLRRRRGSWPPAA